MSQEFENDQIESGEINETPSPEVSEVESGTKSDEGTTPESKQVTSKETQETPFHEHPRFKEIIEQRNQEKERAERLERSYQEIERRLQTLMEQNRPKEQVDPMIAKLQGIDPEFAQYIQGLKSELTELNSLKEWRNQYEQEQTMSRAVTHINTLHEKNKIDPADRELYNELLDNAWRRGEIRNVGDLDAKYAKIHEQYTKRMDALRRAEREAYVTSKKADSKVPASQPKGKAPEQGKSPDWSKDPHEARQQLIKRTLKMAREQESL